jgi:urease accessory protein UreE
MRPTLALLLLLTLAGPALAAGERTVPASDRTAIGVTIYNHDLALIKDRRAFELGQGAHTLAFREVSARIRPETVLVRADGLRVRISSMTCSAPRPCCANTWAGR